MAPAISNMPMSPRGKPPGTPQSFSATPSRFGGVLPGLDAAACVPGVYNSGGGLTSHPVEVVGRIRQHPEGSCESALHVFEGKRLRVKVEQSTREFCLDGVSIADKEDLIAFYTKYVEARVDDVKGGGRCTVMMYGPTGAGKSHTMFGSNSEKGIAYLALRNIMDPNTYGPHGCGPVTVRAAIIEIYNEEIFDMLATLPNAPGLPKNTIIPRVKLEVMGKKLQKATWITGSEHNKLFLEISKTEKRRVIKSTNCNDRSSRSHCMVILEVPSVGGRLVLVDMAGSENIEQAGICMEARLQTGKINQGNGALKRVVEAIANGSDHIPYRDSKLTMLLQDSFEDDGARILMILCASPDVRDIYKTIGTLEYGAKAKCILRLPNSPPKDKGTSGLDAEFRAKVQFKDACIEKLRQTQELKDRAIKDKERLLQDKDNELFNLRLQIEQMETKLTMGSDQQFELKLKLDQFKRETRQELEQEMETRLQDELDKRMEELEKELQKQRLRAEKAEMEIRRLQNGSSALLERSSNAIPLTVSLTGESKPTDQPGQGQVAGLKNGMTLEGVSPSSITLVSNVQLQATEAPSFSHECIDGNDNGNLSLGVGSLERLEAMTDEIGATGSPEYDRGSESDDDLASDDDDYQIPKLEGCASPAMRFSERTPVQNIAQEIMNRLAQKGDRSSVEVGSGQRSKTEGIANQASPGMLGSEGANLTGDVQSSPGLSNDNQTSDHAISRSLFVPKDEKVEIEDDLFTWSGASLHTMGWLPIIHEEQEEDEDISDTGRSKTPAAETGVRDEVAAGSAGRGSFLLEPLFPSNLDRDKFLKVSGESVEHGLVSQMGTIISKDSSFSSWLENVPEEKQGAAEERLHSAAFASPRSMNASTHGKDSTGTTGAQPTDSWRPEACWRDVSASTTDGLRGAVESRSDVAKDEVRRVSAVPDCFVLESIMESLNDLRLFTEVKKEETKDGLGGMEREGLKDTAMTGMDPARRFANQEMVEQGKLGTPVDKFNKPAWGSALKTETELGTHNGLRTPNRPMSRGKEQMQTDERSTTKAEVSDLATVGEPTGEKKGVAASRRARIESIFLLCGERRERKEIASRSDGSKVGDESPGGQKLADEASRTPAGHSEGRRRPPTSAEDKQSRPKASHRVNSPVGSDYQSSATRTGQKSFENSPVASPAASPLKASPQKSKKLLSLSGNLFRLPGKSADHKTNSGTPGSSASKSGRLTPEQLEKNGDSKQASRGQLEGSESRENGSSQAQSDEQCEVYVKWEASKDFSRKLVHMVSITTSASLADLRKEIEPHVSELQRDFSFLFFTGEPSGAPVDRAMEPSVRVASLPDCNNNRSSRLACLRPPAAQTSLAYRSGVPFQSVENRIDLNNPVANMNKPGSNSKHGAKSATGKSGNWAVPPVSASKGLRTLATGFGIRSASEASKLQGSAGTLVGQRL